MDKISRHRSVTLLAAALALSIAACSSTASLERAETDQIALGSTKIRLDSKAQKLRIDNIDLRPKKGSCLRNFRVEVSLKPGVWETTMELPGVFKGYQKRQVTWELGHGMGKSEEVNVRFSAEDCKSRKRMPLLVWNSSRGYSGPQSLEPCFRSRFIGAGAKSPHFVRIEQDLVLGTSKLRIGDLRASKVRKSIGSSYGTLRGTSDILGALVFVDERLVLALPCTSEIVIPVPKKLASSLKSLRVLTLNRSLRVTLDAELASYLR